MNVMAGEACSCSTVSSRGSSIAIECQGLSKTYGSRFFKRRSVKALRDVSFQVSDGQIVGLIGPNGAGKTTLLNLITGLLVPSKGSVRVFGLPPRSLDAKKCLGFMPESSTFQGTYTGRQVLVYHGALCGLSGREARNRADDLLDQLSLTEASGRRCSGYSQGMRQRLALAASLMGHPRLLILDEPSNGLDPVGVIQLRAILHRLRDKGVSVLISSHRLGELEKLTPHYIFLIRGESISLAGKEGITSGGKLRVELVSDGKRHAAILSEKYTVLSATDTEISIDLPAFSDVPGIVHGLALENASIMGVEVQKDGIEDMFLRLHGGKGPT